MKVNLLYLPHPYLNQPDAQIPLGIYYLASALEQSNGGDVQVQNFSSMNEEQAIEKLELADVFGITVTVLELLQANRFAQRIKRKFPNCKVILGGAGTICDEYVDWTVIDSIVKGEAEITIHSILNDILLGNEKRIYIGEQVENLDLLPFPARHLAKDNLGGNIFAYDKNYKGEGSTNLITSRGCPFDCHYCCAKALRCGKTRFRSPQNVYDEIKFVQDTYNIHQFRIADEMFTADIERAKEICRLIKPLNIAWRISTRVKPFTEDLAKTLLDAGCKEISFGIESFDDEVLLGLNKRATSYDNAIALEICKKVGITTRALFMIRTPYQTANTIKRNIAWLKKVPYDIIAVTSFIPLPGSDIWNNPDKHNIEILNKNLDDYNFYFYGSDGRNELKNIIKIKNRSLEEFNEESEFFREWIEKQGKINHG